MSRDIKKEFMNIKGGDFPNWFQSLSEDEKETYRKEVEKLKKKYYGKRQ